MAAKRQITKRFRTEYAKASKKGKGEILDRMCSALGIGRSTARRLLNEPASPRPDGDGRGRTARYSPGSFRLLEQVWLLADMPCSKYLKAMLPQWLPALEAAGELDGFTDGEADELMAMGAATIDRHLKATRDAARLRGISSTRAASEPLRNSITIRKAGDELDGLPGAVEADTVAHCGPTLMGEFCRTLTIVDFATGWTENASARNNSFTMLSGALEAIEARIPFRIRSFDSDNGSEFINHDMIAWLQQRDIEQTRSRPYRKNDGATVESRNNHVVRRHAFYYRYELPELDPLNELWELVEIKANLFTPSRKPHGWRTGRGDRPTRLYDEPRTPWQRLLELDGADRAEGGGGWIPDERRERFEKALKDTDPAGLVRRIHELQDRIEETARPRTEALLRRRTPGMAYLDKAPDHMEDQAREHGTEERQAETG